MSSKSLFTSESVSEGHPDKIADQISDSILDNFIAFDPNAKIACETLVTTGQVILSGEVKSKTYIDVQEITRNVIEKIGYTKSEYKFDSKSCGILSVIHEQSPDINRGVDKDNPEDQGAGDQGMMFGYACNETPTLMPAPIYYAHRLTERLTEVRKKGIVDYFYPDGKSQVTLAYEGNTPTHADAIVIAQQHAEDVEHDKIVEDIIEHVIEPIMPAELLDPKPDFHINATGRFVIGGPHGDCGLTGRKIIVDTYGGYAPHGGGAFSGKDPSKVDRSAAYMARYIAKNIVAAKLADKCEVQFSYSIGVAEPTSFYLKTFDTGVMSDDKLTEITQSIFPLKPAGIIEHLKLKHPRYRQTAAYGHFGREDASFTWEQTDMVDKLKLAANERN